MAISDFAAQRAMAKRRVTKAMEMLLGLVTGMVADGHLHDGEIQFLNMWLAQNGDVAAEWPGSVVYQRVRAVLDDGMITDEERAHLLTTLQELATADFSETGSAAPEVLGLPLQNVPVLLAGASVCHTGVFLYGTRERCEALTLASGGVPVQGVTRKLSYLVVGSNVSPDWAHTSYGRKIEAAVALQSKGLNLHIVSERIWLSAAGVQA
jgi:NAD-dependent DNA ligase